MFDDVASVTMRSALDSLSLRQRTIADNIANVQTPGFRAGRVSFEDSLRAATDAGDPASAETTVGRSLEPTRLDGNNVNLDTETLNSVDTNLRYQLMLKAVDHDFSVLRSSMRTSG
jgi:flagellar basal-body rod protein FlgB